MEVVINEKRLTPAEQDRLDELEAIIRENFLAYVAVGNALLEIRESRLYRNKERRTWEEYCRRIWDMGHDYADRTIAAAKVTGNLLTIVSKDDGSPDWELLPANESQARELARLEPEEQARVWRLLIDYQRATANERHPFKITAKTVKKTVKEFKGEQVTRRVRAATEQVRKQAKGEDKRSAQFVAVFEHFMAEVTREQAAGWRHTSRQAVFESLCAAAQAVGECGEETTKARRVLWRGTNIDKLLAAGLAIFRIAADNLLIEQLTAVDQWLVYGEYATPEQGLAAFEDLMLEPTNIRA
ncbi:MAG: hypothetical protein FWD79_12485 [Desulfobulbus sp.]|nr:hypothetical protein [Desulfobulbus sp.]